MAIKDYNGSDVTSKLLATQSANGFMSASDKKKVDISSNPNLLINSDFKIWQRGDSVSGSKTDAYTADRWCIGYPGSFTLSKHNNGLVVTKLGSGGTCYLYQKIEYDPNLDGQSIVMTYSVNNKTIAKYATLNKNGSGDNLYLEIPHISDLKQGDIVNWAKVEIGNISTKYIYPNISEELLKCQRYYEIVSLEFGQCAWFDVVADAICFVSRIHKKRLDVPTIIPDYDSYKLRSSKSGFDAKEYFSIKREIYYATNQGTVARFTVVMSSTITNKIDCSIFNFEGYKGSASNNKIIIDAEIY